MTASPPHGELTEHDLEGEREEERGVEVNGHVEVSRKAIPPATIEYGQQRGEDGKEDEEESRKILLELIG